MKILSQKVLASIATAALALGSATSALSQTDSETSVITLNYMSTQVIDIAFVNDLNLIAPPDGTPGPILAEDTFCVAGMGFPNFGITFSNPANPVGGPFELDSSVPGAPPIMYEVFFQNNAGPGMGIPVTPDNLNPGNMIQTPMCMDPTMDNAKFSIEIQEPEWAGRAPDAPFTGLLEITVQAE
ncbi:hypothetical protein [Microbulbifer sp. THAF38]|uniref:hypothetical protein n=1 Tax=Microbulbifer sp. THAF38 TaxID=2587856 RepID=UPI0012694C51|nr:hypothetical protein [Microbulbifer sp. THAF38]QFT55663.1 hypothetical protein FIU95_14030 [Microbulbifer sp. THAF38]